MLLLAIQYLSILDSPRLAWTDSSDTIRRQAAGFPAPKEFRFSSRRPNLPHSAPRLQGTAPHSTAQHDPKPSRFDQLGSIPSHPIPSNPPPNHLSDPSPLAPNCPQRSAEQTFLPAVVVKPTLPYPEPISLKPHTCNTLALTDRTLCPTDQPACTG